MLIPLCTILKTSSLEKCYKSGRVALAVVVKEERGMVDLIEFCSKEPWRPQLSQPFEYDGYTYYTDGRVAIRTVGADGSHVTLEYVGKYLKRQFTQNSNNTTMVPLPAIPNEQSMACYRCEGTGGQIPKHCETCACQCSLCSGTGVISATTVDDVFGINNVFVSMVGIQNVAKLENVMINSDAKPRSHMYFTFNGGEGIIPTMANKKIVQTK